MKLFKIFCRCGIVQYDLFEDKPLVVSEYRRAFVEHGFSGSEAIERLKDKVEVLEVFNCYEEAVHS